MLIKCPECGLQASDKALSCPHCGFPFQQNLSRPKIRKSNRKKRLPNGFGQITEIKGRSLRKPFRAMITVGKNEFGRPICKLLEPEAYFATYNEAYEALMKYNQNPFDFRDITMEELYDKWSTKHYPEISESSVRSAKAAWKYCTSVYDVKVVDFRMKHLQYCLDNGSYEYNGKMKHLTPALKLRVKDVLNLMMDYAVSHEMTDKNYARMLQQDSNIKKALKKNRKPHICFTDEELEVLWKNIDKPYVSMMLIQCYSGWRPRELVILKVDNVHLDENYMIGGIKTEYGENRYVPIHPKIKGFVKEWYDDAIKKHSAYLFNYIETSYKNSYVNIQYPVYKRTVINTCKELGLNIEHRPHDFRKTFITHAKRCSVDEYALKYIVGHSIDDITERVYTERTNAWLQDEMRKIR